MNSNQRLPRHTSPGPDWVLWLIIAGCAALVAVGVLIAGRMISDARAQAALHCPAPDHPVKAQVLVHGHDRWEWICGESLTITGKSR